VSDLGGPKGIPRDEFIRVYRTLQSAKGVAEHFGISVRNVQSRRERLEALGIVLPQRDHRPAYRRASSLDAERAVCAMSVQNGHVLIGSDFHIRPGHRTTMQMAFIKFAHDLRPEAIVLNGDVCDFPQISKHPSIGWESRPTVKQELEAVGDFLGDLLKGLKRTTRRAWCAGNHDLRFESRIAANLPELAGLDGVHLKDRFPQWTPCWRVDLNDDIVIKHRGQGGEHADWNNVVKGGKTMVTGHDHRANVTAYRDYRGVRWGVRCGYMGESPLDSQFVHYLEANEAMPWIPAFAVLTIRDGRLLWPELVTKHDDGTVNWRGEVLTV
jgi:hypothetical protein